MTAGEDERFMRRAIELAQQAFDLDEVPVGAVVVRDGEILGEGHNAPLAQSDPSAHAEVVALRRAAQKAENYRLPEATLYVTVEPCMMCAGAMIHARVKRLVFGAAEPKAGVVVSHPLLASEFLNHRIEIAGQVLAEQCSELMSSFFQKRRMSAE